MKPIAGTDAPDTGLFKQGDLAAIYCRLPDNNGMVWQLAVNLYGHAGQQYAGTVGFLPFAATNDSAAAVECGAT